MISKEKFVKIMDRLRETTDLQEKVEELFRSARDNIENDFCNGGSFMISHEDIVIELLGEMFFDKQENIDWETHEKHIDYPNISWWIYETDYGRDKEMNKIYNEDKTIYKSLDTAEDLYDYLIECMEDKDVKDN